MPIFLADFIFMAVLVYVIESQVVFHFNLKKEGGIHRLHNRDDEDNDNNTWNGNSTQQM